MMKAATQRGETRPLRRRRLSLESREGLKVAAVFTLPWTIGFATFLLYPAGASFYYSLTDYNIFTPATFIGLRNYSNLLTNDDYFRLSLANTAYLTFIGVPVITLFGLLLALLLNQKLRGLAIYRTIFFLPSIVPTVALSLLFLWIFNPQYGMVNGLLSKVGISGPTWFADPVWSKPTLILMQMWQVGTTMIVYLAGLQGIPQELYEVADLDGASWWQRIRYITVPLVSGVTLFNLITGFIYAFQFFTQAYVVGAANGQTSATGVPQGSLLFYSMYLYDQGFRYLKMGYASAMAWLLLVIIMLVTLVTLRTSRHWAYYEGEPRR